MTYKAPCLATMMVGALLFFPHQAIASPYPCDYFYHMGQIACCYADLLPSGLRKLADSSCTVAHYELGAFGCDGSLATCSAE